MKKEYILKVDDYDEQFIKVDAVSAEKALLNFKQFNIKAVYEITKKYVVKSVLEEIK
jgi:hypothetical protein